MHGRVRGIGGTNCPARGPLTIVLEPGLVGILEPNVSRCVGAAGAERDEVVEDSAGAWALAGLGAMEEGMVCWAIGREALASGVAGGAQGGLARRYDFAGHVGWWEG